MIRIIFNKLWGDLRTASGQTAMLCLALFIGQAAMTAAFMARSVVASEIARNFALAKAPEITVDASNVPATVIAKIAAVPGVEKVDAVATLNGRYRLKDGTWRTILLFGRRDFTNLPVSRIFPKSGTWPPAGDQVVIEQSGVTILGKDIGETINVQFGGKKNFSLRFAGIVHDPAQAPSWQENAVYGYTPLATLERLAGPRNLQFQILLAPAASPTDVAQSVAAALVAQGGEVLRINPVAASHPHGDLMMGLLMLLSAFSLLAFFLSLFLAASLVASMMQRQERHLAVIRALGGSRLRIAGMQGALVLVPALPALVLGAFVGTTAAAVLQRVIARQLNIEIFEPEAAAGTRGVLLAFGIVGVLLTVLIPIAASLRRPIREVLQTGLARVSRPWFRTTALKPIDRLAASETFQRPVRSAITIAALSISVAALLISTNLYVSLVAVVDRLAAARHDTITVAMSEPPNKQILVPELMRIKQSRGFEFWDRKLITISAPGGSGERLMLYNPPANTKMGLPPVVDGRWPSGPGEIAVSKLALGHFGNLRLALGEPVTITADGKSVNAKLVGLVDEFGMSVWAGESVFGSVSSARDRAVELRMEANASEATATLAMVERAIMRAGSFPVSSSTKDVRRMGMVNHFFAFYQFLLVASLTAGLVGAAALSASIGSNVLNRTREIAVLRAMGAQRSHLFRLVAGQALTVAIVSYLIAVLFSFPISFIAVRLMQDRALHIDMPLTIAVPTYAAVALGAVLLGLLAALGPAWRISKMPIREALAYE